MFQTVSFRHPFPDDDARFDAEGNPESPGALALAEGIHALVRPVVSDISPIEPHGFSGWEFRVRFEECSIIHVLNPVDDTCFLTLSIPGFLLKSLCFQHPRRTLGRYQALLTSCLEHLPGVSKIAWQPVRW